MIDVSTEKQILSLMQDSFSRWELEERTRLLFHSFLSLSDFESEFNSLFYFSYKLVFGDIPYKQAMLLLLQNYYRNEYYVKEKLYSNLLKNTCYMSEFPVGECRADILSIERNYPICYEIKTKYDSLSRLDRQISTYTNAFPYTVVICSEEKKDEVLNMIPIYCGLYSYQNRSNSRIVKRRSAALSPVLDSKAILDCFRVSERRVEFGTDDCEQICSNYSALELSQRLAVRLKQESGNRLYLICSM